MKKDVMEEGIYIQFEHKKKDIQIYCELIKEFKKHLIPSLINLVAI
jgi:hypothetical protein